MQNELACALRGDFLAFSAIVLQELDNISILHQSYLARIAHVFTNFYNGKIEHLILRAPPRHLKTKMKACLAAFELGRNPRLEVAWISYDLPIAAEGVDYIREILRLPCYQPLFPKTCLSLDHDRSGDFRTSAGGGVRAIGIHGKVAGKGIDLLVGDDLLDISDWDNEEEINEVNASLERIIPSRFNTPLKGRAILSGHHLNPNDSGSYYERKGWTVESLPFEAVADEDIELGHEIWHRKQGELLRPDAYSEEMVAELRGKLDPPYQRYFQQGAGKPPIMIEMSDFRLCERGRHANEPMVLSVDTALRSAPTHSANVIQAWAFDGTNHFLREEFCERCSYETLEARFCRMVKKLCPYAVIIEETANGPGLIRCAQQLGIAVVAVKPIGSKALRLAAHTMIIRQGKIFIARHLFGEFTQELLHLPRFGTDRTDAFSQYLSHRPPVPRTAVQPARSVPYLSPGSRVPRYGVAATANAGIAYGSQLGNYAPPLHCGWGRLRSSRIG